MLQRTHIINRVHPLGMQSGRQGRLGGRVLVDTCSYMLWKRGWNGGEWLERRCRFVGEAARQDVCRFWKRTSGASGEWRTSDVFRVWPVSHGKVPSRAF